MASADSLTAFLKSKRFWTDLLQLTNRDVTTPATYETWLRRASTSTSTTAPTLTIKLPFTDRHLHNDYHIDVAIASDNFKTFSLSFSTADQGPVEIATADLPHALLWSEVESICKAVMNQSILKKGTSDEQWLYRHPGVPLLLLHRFAPICVGDDAGKVEEMLQEAWVFVLGQQGMGSGSDVGRLVQNVDFRGRGYRWTKGEWYMGDEGGVSDWLVEREGETAKDVETLRCRTIEEHEAWTQLVFAAESLREIPGRQRATGSRGVPGGDTWSGHGSASNWLKAEEYAEELYAEAAAQDAEEGYAEVEFAGPGDYPEEKEEWYI